jgi:hypothetical protein
MRIVGIFPMDQEPLYVGWERRAQLPLNSRQGTSVDSQTNGKEVSHGAPDLRSSK